MHIHKSSSSPCGGLYVYPAPAAIQTVTQLTKDYCISSLLDALKTMESLLPNKNTDVINLLTTFPPSK